MESNQNKAKDKKRRSKKALIPNLKCTLCSDGTKRIDYKDTYKIKKFISRRGKIVPRSRSGTCAKHQRMLAKAIKVARFMAILPYINRE